MNVLFYFLHLILGLQADFHLECRQIGDGFYSCDGGAL